MKINIFSDVHGRYDEFISLKKEMPEVELEIFTGDLINRGKNSLKMLNYVMNNLNSKTILGNHEFLFLCYLGLENKNFPKLDKEDLLYGKNIYLSNNFGFIEEIENSLNDNENNKFMKKLKEFLVNLNIEIKMDKLWITHAPPIIDSKFLKNKEDIIKFIFNKEKPQLLKGDYFNIHGHTGKGKIWNKKKNKLEERDLVVNQNKIEQGNFKNYICIDQIPKGLTGINIDSETMKYKIYFKKNSKKWENEIYKNKKTN